MSDSKSPIWCYEKRIPEDICDKIIKEFDAEDLQLSETFKGLSLDTRNVLSKQVPQEHWLNGFLYYFGVDANIFNFNFNITNLQQTEFLKYSKGMFYRPHTDISFDKNNSSHYRKLTIIIQLSDIDEYDGGEIEIFDDGFERYKVPKTKGTIAVFPSYLTHHVKKITSGTRYSLVGWIVGPAFA
jgi:PKHD-type hydroxylase